MSNLSPKCSRQIRGEFLAIIFNTSIEPGTFPTKLNIPKVIPIFKPGDATSPNNYRPTSLLSIFNKIFEKLIYKRVKSYLTSKEIISKSQYGFREKHSTEHACSIMWRATGIRPGHLHKWYKQLFKYSCFFLFFLILQMIPIYSTWTIILKT